MDWNTIESILAVLSPLLVVLLGFFAAIYIREKERRESIERQLSEHKYKAYITLLDIFFDLMKSTKKREKIEIEDLTDRMFDANKDLMLYGSDDVVKKYQEWLKNARNNRANLGNFGEIVILIRKDMGNPKTKIKSEDILRQLIAEYDEAKAKGLID